MERGVEGERGLFDGEWVGRWRARGLMARG